MRFLIAARRGRKKPRDFTNKDRLISFDISEEESDGQDKEIKMMHKVNHSKFRGQSSFNFRSHQLSMSRFENAKDDVTGNVGAAPNCNNITTIILEEEKYESPRGLTSEGLEKLGRSMVKSNQSLIKKEPVQHFDVIPISVSENFHKADYKKGYEEFLSLLKVRTLVIDSNRKETIGMIRSIFADQQMDTLR
mmetsp:Transcript_33583/g.38606  ORF Transcript_33583/g.38606 Transcript_33583/m.38606 type:complete len:192 (+) Transcript_33583:594-1169(+)